jgi:3',5'-cyclic AMP phosphodiesterase CpdA
VRRIVHLSDLHFGRDLPELLGPLLTAVNALSPDLVAISGDLTQRARRAQFHAARDFIERIKAPVLVVPGNHDVPLHNLLGRLISPWRRYRRWVSGQLQPEFRDDELIVLGVNTVNPFAHQSGIFNRRALDRIDVAFQDAGKDRARIIVAHHPLEHQPSDRKALMRGADAALDGLARLGVDVVLTGHLHSWRAAPFTARTGRRAVLQVHAGTGLSSRLRGHENDFNLLGIDGAAIDVTRYVANDRAARFDPAQRCRFVCGPNGWAPVDPA